MREKLIQRISQADVLVLHSSGLHQFEIGPEGWWPRNPEARLPKPDPDGRLRLFAALEAWKRIKEETGREIPIIVCGGNVFKDLAPSTAYVMAEILRRRGIPEEAIHLAEGGNTVADMREAKKIMREEGWQGLNSIHISNGYHLVLEVLCKNPLRGILGKRKDFIPAEELLKIRDRRYQKMMDDYEAGQAFKESLVNQRKRSRLVQVPVIGPRLYDWLVKRRLAEGIKSTPFDRFAFKEMVTGKR